MALATTRLQHLHLCRAREGQEGVGMHVLTASDLPLFLGAVFLQANSLPVTVSLDRLMLAAPSEVEAAVAVLDRFGYGCGVLTQTSIVCSVGAVSDLYGQVKKHTPQTTVTVQVEKV